MSERCHSERGVFIPGCMGGAVYGKRGCTCPPRNARDEIEKLTARVAKLERIVSDLRGSPSPGGTET